MDFGFYQVFSGLGFGYSFQVIRLMSNKNNCESFNIKEQNNSLFLQQYFLF